MHGVPDGRVRYYSIREAARIQTFPDQYALHGAWSEAMRQLGNAVPVELAQIIVSSVVQHVRRERVSEKGDYSVKNNRLVVN